MYRAKIFSWNSKKRQQRNNLYQQYLTSNLILNAKSFSWDANTSTGLLKPPAMAYLPGLLGLILIILADSLQESLEHSYWYTLMRIPAWLLILYAGIELWVHQQKQTINPLSYDGISFHFTGSTTGFLINVVCLPAIFLTGVWGLYQMIEIPGLYRIAIVELLIICIIPVALYLRDKFKVQNTHFGESAFSFHATLSDYFKYQLKIVLIIMLVSELIIIYFYSMEALGQFNLDQYSDFFSIGFFVMLFSSIVYAVIEIKIDHKNLLVNNSTVNGCRLKSSIQTKAFFHQIYFSVLALMESIDNPKLTLSQQLKLYQLTNISLQVNTKVNTAEITLNIQRVKSE